MNCVTLLGIQFEGSIKNNLHGQIKKLDRIIIFFFVIGMEKKNKI